MDDLLAFFGGKSRPVVAHLTGAGKLTLEDVEFADKALKGVQDGGRFDDKSYDFLTRQFGARVGESPASVDRIRHSDLATNLSAWQESCSSEARALAGCLDKVPHSLFVAVRAGKPRSESTSTLV